MKIAVVFGTRPEAIKLAPVVLALKRCAVQSQVCVTGQHREMLDQILEVFDITPDVDLGIMRPNQRLAQLTSRALEGVDAYLRQERPDLVVVQGDTTTAFATTLAAFYNSIQVAHVEAGLRSGSLRAPWPEEANRVLTSRLADIHFAPTEGNRLNLLAEGIPAAKIYVTGNTVIDALLLARDRARNMQHNIPGLPERIQRDAHTRMVLITGHRRESFGEGFRSICCAIRQLAGRFSDIDFVYPVHLNPNVRSVVTDLLGTASAERERLSNIHLLEPVPYLPFVALMDRATIILTDSGGVQEEGPSLGKPVLVMRDNTERPEGIEAGTAKLVGTKTQDIVSEVSLLLTDQAAHHAMARAVNPYGDGLAAKRIIDVIVEGEKT